MKQIFKKISISFLIVFVCSLAGVLLLCLAFSLPIDKIEQNVAESVKTLYEEGMYPHLFSWCTSRLDNSTDSIMLLEASNNTSDSLLNKVLLVYRGTISEDAQYYSLIDKYINNIEFDGSTTYAKYWHGYLTLLKPLLCIFTYKQIRIINGITQTLLNFILCFLLYKNNKSKYILPYILTVLVIMPICLANSLQFSSCFYISIIASIVILIKSYKSKQDYWIVFLLVGICLAYFDFLTYPIATLGVPLIIYIIVSKNNWKKTMINMLQFSLFWVFGYGLMWFMKWAYASLLTEQNVLKEAINTALLRSLNVNSDNQEISVYMSLDKNISKFIDTPFFILSLLYFFIAFIKNKNKILKNNINKTIPFIFTFILPLFWYVLVKNHSCIHAYFTNKALLVSLLSLLFAPNYLSDNTNL